MTRWPPTGDSKYTRWLEPSWRVVVTRFLRAFPIGFWQGGGAGERKTNGMSSREIASECSEPQGDRFRTTHWSVVLNAREDTAPGAAAALEQLCAVYWPPLYFYLRRQGHTAHHAEDLTQSFFAQLLQQDGLQSVHPSKGKFRSFLLASLKHYLANERDRAGALKRGGAVSFISWEEAGTEERYRQAESLSVPPDKAFEQTWATTLLEQVLAKLRADYVEAGQGGLFEALQVYLTGDKGAVPYAETAARLNLGESALKMSIQRLRRRFGELLRAEVAHTVSTPAEIDEEIRALFAAARL
jgi:RNA polymerase sigma-70 factor (ECF subfamily)